MQFNHYTCGHCCFHYILAFCCIFSVALCLCVVLCLSVALYSQRCHLAYIVLQHCVVSPGIFTPIILLSAVCACSGYSCQGRASIMYLSDWGLLQSCMFAVMSAHFIGQLFLFFFIPLFLCFSLLLLLLLLLFYFGLCFFQCDWCPCQFVLLYFVYPFNWRQPFPKQVDKQNGSLRRFQTLIEELTAGSKHIHVIQVHYKRKRYFNNINLLRKGLTQEINLDGGSI